MVLSFKVCEFLRKGSCDNKKSRKSASNGDAAGLQIFKGKYLIGRSLCPVYFNKNQSLCNNKKRIEIPTEKRIILYPDASGK